MNLVFLGPPGAGKGTQARLLHEKLKIPTISTGDILREACQKGTPAGREAEGYMRSGQLVPDDVVLAIIRDRLAMEDTRAGYILDGFPRTLEQARELDQMLAGLGQKLNAVVYFDVDAGDVVERLSGRRMCRKCGAGYHIKFSPPEKEGVCDACGGDLFQRDDDKAETINNRLGVYAQKTQPLVDFYNQKKFLRRVKGTGPVGQITQDLFKVLGIP